MLLPPQHFPHQTAGLSAGAVNCDQLTGEGRQHTSGPVWTSLGHSGPVWDGPLIMVKVKNGNKRSRGSQPLGAITRSNYRLD